MKTKLTILLIVIANLSYAQINYRNFYTDNIGKKKGIALVLGNDIYQNSGNLTNAVKDAMLMAKTLKSEQYDIEVGYNLERSELLDAISSFNQKLANYKTAVIYYAGHGVQLDEENYLLPTGTKGNNKIALKSSGVSLGDLFSEINNPNIPKIILLDACRENPFLENLVSTTMSVKGSGLAEVAAKINSMVVFSTSPNTVIPDANQFTEVLTTEINNGGCITDIIIRTTSKVKALDENQHIWSEQNLSNNICFGDLNNPSNLDSDGDGVIDSIDKCPYQAGELVYNGCPELSQESNSYLRFSGTDEKGNDNIGIKDKRGNTIIKPNSKYAILDRMSSNGIARFITYSGKMGYIDKNQKEIVGDNNDFVSNFVHGRGLIINGIFKTIIDPNGNEITIRGNENSYSPIRVDKEVPVIFVKNENDLYGMSDIHGNIFIEPQFDYLRDYSEGITIGEKDGKLYYINDKGKTKFVKDFAGSNSFRGEYAFVKNKEDKVGYINKQGNPIEWINPSKIKFSNLDGNIIIQKELKEKQDLIKPEEIITNSILNRKLNSFLKTLDIDFNYYKFDLIKDNFFVLKTSVYKWEDTSFDIDENGNWYKSDKGTWIAGNQKHVFLSYKNGVFKLNSLVENENINRYGDYYIVDEVKTDDDDWDTEGKRKYVNSLLRTYDYKGNVIAIYIDEETEQITSKGEGYSGSFFSFSGNSYKDFFFLIDVENRLWIMDDSMQPLKKIKIDNSFQKVLIDLLYN